MRQVNCTILQPDGTQLPLGTTVDATLQIDTDCVTYAGVVADNGRLIYTLGNDFGQDWGAAINVIAPGCSPWTGRAVVVPLGPSEGPLIQLETGSNPFRSWPARPTRAQVIAFQGSMQGLEVWTEQYGTIPYWEGIIGWFNAADRQRIYAAKRAKPVPDTHCGAWLSGCYREPGQFYQDFPPLDWSQNLPGLLALLQEIVQAGFKAWVPLAGDGLVPDPQGATYGHDWLMENLERILNGLAPAIPHILFSPGYDGIIGYDEQTQQFGPWQPDQVSAYLELFRALAPDGYSSIEPSAGPLGGTLPDFITPAAYDALDTILNEFQSPPNNSITWQSADRVLGPAFVRPLDMPPTEDPDAPFGPDSPKWRLRQPTSRGPIVAVGFEVCTYYAVRGMPVEEQLRQVAYVKGCGYSYSG